MMEAEGIKALDNWGEQMDLELLKGPVSSFKDPLEAIATTSPLLNRALAADYLILSSAGSHAREDLCTIMKRNTADITKFSHTLWLQNSIALRPDAVQTFCQDFGACDVIFLSRKRDGKAKGPSTDEPAKGYSRDNKTWLPLQPGLSHVTGLINCGTTGLWFAALEKVEYGSLSLDCFHKHPNGQVLDRFHAHESAYPVHRVAPVRPGPYEIVAVGQLSWPFAVWLEA
jgi:hypothetical protein